MWPFFLLRILTVFVLWMGLTYITQSIIVGVLVIFIGIAWVMSGEAKGETK